VNARPFRKVLVANRGEIAVRVLTACRTQGLATVAVASEADVGARHARLADELVVLGPAPARESYLVAAKILDAARATGADAVHPGFGFLSENAAFARAVLDAGLVWIGPPPTAMEAMGLKVPSRERMKAAGVPVVPGSHDLSPAPLATIGFPIVIKASAGGGGKGMRVVRSEAELAAAIESCRREAEAAFGDPTLYAERYLEHPRHVEIQVFGDAHGRVVALGERECSLQRRHQKVVEESPSPVVTPQLRARMSEAAVAAARAVGYVNAGTVEFLLDADGSFFFLEMNTRLQVEHPVTEEAWGLDLVTLQLSVAAGEPLPDDLPAAPVAHAIEARVYAEDPENGFLPQVGTVLAYEEPGGPGVRVDSGIEAGSEVSVHYDPMLAKVVARGRTREEARRRLVDALGRTVILGVATNVSWLRRLLETPDFVRGDLDTSLLSRLEVPASPEPPEEVLVAVAGVHSAGDGRGVAAAHAAFPDPFAGGAFRVLA
jgi:acetyl-CoA/propionyl-CoA carboxylase biotin carboxyl carrier protein